MALLLALGFLASLAPHAVAATSLTPWLAANPAAADAGGLVDYNVSLDIRSGPAGRVWANLTIPTASVHYQDAGVPSECTTNPTTNKTLHYDCTNLSPRNVTWTVTVQIQLGPPDGALLVARLAVNYTDNSGVLQPEVRTTATVRMALPVLQVTHTAAPNPVDPGAVLAYNVTVRNAGSGAAGEAWLNVTLPPEATFVRVRDATFPGSPPCGGGQDCILRNVGPGGVESYVIEVRVAPTAAQGTTLYSSLAVDRTDVDGTLLAPETIVAPASVRVIRDLTLAKVADAAIAYPGGHVTFTIWYNNTASTTLGAGWINDTLPAGLSYESSTPAATAAGSSVRWQVPSVPRGANTLTLVTLVSDSVSNGTLLMDNATADYVTPSGANGQRALATAFVLVSTIVPRFDGFAKIASVRTARDGDTVHFTVWFNNTGSATAGDVIIRDTVPAGTVLTNAEPTYDPSRSRNGTYVWVFTDVAPGSHSLSYDLVVQGASGTIVNFAYLNFTDSQGRSLSPLGPRSASLRIEEGGGGGGSDILFLLAALIVLGVAGAAAYRIVGARRRLVIDEVFLLHKDGLLIKHYTRRVRPDVDSDILSGMLIAVQNFVNESFIGSEGLQREGQLDELRFGDFKIVIERGRWVIVAAVLSGDPTNRVKGEVKAAIADLEAALGTKLEGWTGEMKSVEGADRFMQNLIAGRYRGSRGKG